MPKRSRHTNISTIYVICWCQAPNFYDFGHLRGLFGSFLLRLWSHLGFIGVFEEQIRPAIDPQGCQRGPWNCDFSYISLKSVFFLVTFSKTRFLIDFWMFFNVLVSWKYSKNAVRYYKNQGLQKFKKTIPGQLLGSFWSHLGAFGHAFSDFFVFL